MPERVRTPAHRRHPFIAAAALLGLTAWRLFRGPRHMHAGSRRARANPVTDYERSDWPIGPVAIVYAGIVALLVVCCFVLIAAYRTSLPDVDRSLRIVPPGPRLQTNAPGDLARFRADEQKRLDGYSWIDRETGRVRIPIREAMERLVETGLPGFPKAAP